MTDSIHIAPDIRKQTLEEAQENINKKRVQRLILANQYKQTVTDKAKNIWVKDGSRFDKQAGLLANQLDKIAEQIEKAEKRLQMLSEIHNGLVAVEGVLKGE